MAIAAAVLLVAPAAEAELRFQREDGTMLRTAAEPRVWCGAWEPDVAVPALHVAVRPRKGSFFWHLTAVRRDLLRGEAFEFPHSFVFDEPSDALLFAADGRNEASTAEEESAGRVFYRRISCRPGARVSLSLTARLGSEVSGDAIHVNGRFSGRVRAGTAPPWA